MCLICRATLLASFSWILFLMLGDYVTFARVPRIFILGVGVGVCATLLEVSIFVFRDGVEVRGYCFGIFAF